MEPLRLVEIDTWDIKGAVLRREKVTNDATFQKEIVLSSASSQPTVPSFRSSSCPTAFNRPYMCVCVCVANLPARVRACVEASVTQEHFKIRRR